MKDNKVYLLILIKIYLEHIITWNDPEIEEELAISFINLRASNEVWYNLIYN